MQTPSAADLVATMLVFAWLMNTQLLTRNRDVCQLAPKWMDQCELKKEEVR